MYVKYNNIKDEACKRYPSSTIILGSIEPYGIILNGHDNRAWRLSVYVNCIYNSPMGYNAHKTRSHLLETHIAIGY